MFISKFFTALFLTATIAYCSSAFAGMEWAVTFINTSNKDISISYKNRKCFYPLEFAENITIFAHETKTLTGQETNSWSCNAELFAEHRLELMGKVLGGSAEEEPFPITFIGDYSKSIRPYFRPKLTIIAGEKSDSMGDRAFSAMNSNVRALIVFDAETSHPKFCMVNSID